MYEKFYGIKEKTFNLTPDPDFFYMSEGHETAISHLEYAIAENKGITVLTGEVGSGKTTIINYLLYHMQLDINIGLINNTNIPASQMMRTICNEFEIDVENKDRTQLINTLQQFLIDKYAAKERVLLIIDEAQNLPIKTIEEIRMISNLETEKDQLIQMMLVGQPELKYKLQKSELRQFAQRVAIYYHLKGLSRKEVGEYIQYRLKIGAAQNLDLFKKEAVDLIYSASRGIPRLINIMCDSALVYGYADGMKAIDKATIETVLAERDLTSPFMDDPGGATTDSANRRIDGNFDNQLRSLENRIELLENSVAQLVKKETNSPKLPKKYTQLNIELLKMLEKSHKSRLKLLDLINQLQIQNPDKSVHINKSIHQALQKMTAE